MIIEPDLLPETYFWLMDTIYADYPENADFIGRTHERARLTSVEKEINAQAIIILGRRRIGKTELIEQHFSKQ